MKITFSSYDHIYDDIVCYDKTGWIENIKKFATTKVRQQEVGNRNFLLSEVEDLFANPEKDNKETDLPFSDGVIHYNALYKPTPFVIKLFDNNKELMNIFNDLYLTRGIFQCVVETDWETKNTFPCRALEYDEFKMEMSFDNPSVVVTCEQDAHKSNLSSMQYSDLFPGEMKRPSVNLYPHLTYDYIQGDDMQFGVVNPDVAVIDITFNGTDDSTLTDVTINGQSITYPDFPLSITDNTRFSINYISNEYNVYSGTSLTQSVPFPAGTPNCPTSISLNVEFGSSVTSVDATQKNIITNVNLKSSGSYNTLQ